MNADEEKPVAAWSARLTTVAAMGHRGQNTARSARAVAASRRGRCSHILTAISDRSYSVEAGARVPAEDIYQP